MNRRIALPIIGVLCLAVIGLGITTGSLLVEEDRTETIQITVLPILESSEGYARSGPIDLPKGSRVVASMIYKGEVILVYSLPEPQEQEEASFQPLDIEGLDPDLVVGYTTLTTEEAKVTSPTMATLRATLSDTVEAPLQPGESRLASCGECIESLSLDGLTHYRWHIVPKDFYKK